MKAISTFFKDLHGKKPIILKKKGEIKSPIIKAFLPTLTYIKAAVDEHAGEHKGRHVGTDIITTADFKITEILNKFIRENLKNDTVISEEEETKIRGDNAVLFDPVDGSKVFSEGKQHFATAFCRIGKEPLSIIWQPANEILAVSDKKSVLILGSEKRPKLSKAFRVNYNSYASEIENHRGEEALIQNIIKKPEPVMLGSGSCEATALCLGELELKMRFSEKLWDFFPGAVLAEALGKEVFHMDTNKDVFPVDKKTLIEMSANLGPTRRIKSICIAASKELRNKVCKEYKNIQNS